MSYPKCTLTWWKILSENINVCSCLTSAPDTPQPKFTTLDQTSVNITWTPYRLVDVDYILEYRPTGIIHVCHVVYLLLFVNRLQGFRFFSRLVGRGDPWSKKWWVIFWNDGPKHIKLTTFDIWVAYSTYTLTQTLVCTYMYVYGLLIILLNLP